jgi:tetrahydromethanopterin S-methyltransferase subunit G
MEPQHIFDLLLAGIIGLLSWWGKKMDNEMTAMRNEMNAHKLEVAKDYVPKADFETAVKSLGDKLDRVAAGYVTNHAFDKFTTDVMNKLDKIETKVDNKVDK